MRHYIICIFLFIAIGTQAQQINPVPDYVFRNQMSVGRNAVTDTAAYFSVGPRYGAVKGMMPPMVIDTASMSATKRNGLLIFSIQKNKYLYWDSVGSKWAEMAGTAGSAITGSGVAGYMPEFTTSTNLDTTRLYHSAGRFAIGSTTTTNGVFNVYGGQAYFDTSLKVGTQTLFADESKNEVYVNTTSDSGAYALQVAGSIYNTTGAVLAATSGNVGIGTASPSSKLHVSGGDVRIDNTRSYNFTNNTGGTSSARLQMFSDNNLYMDNPDGALNFRTQSFESAMIITNGKNVGIGTITPSQKLDVIGIITNNNSAYFATSTGNVGIGTTSPSQKLSVNGIGAFNTRLVFNGFNQLVGDGNQFNDGGGISGFGIRNDSGQVMLAAGGNTPQFRVSKSGEILINTNTDAGDYRLQVSGNIYNTGSITTGAPSGGSIKPWKIGEAATVSPTSPNRTLRVEIDGTVYYIHAKTTND